MTDAARMPWVVGVSGASGTPYAAAVLRGLFAAGQPVDLIVSRAARLTLLDETGIAWRDDAASLREWLASSLEPSPLLPDGAELAARLSLVGDDALADDDSLAAGFDVRFYSPGDFAAPPSSGSYRTRGMVVVPASTAAVAGIAMGLSKDLLQRAADVTLKERRPLVIAPREMPLTGTTLRHLVRLDESGAIVAPASPAFYARPKSMQQMVDFVAGKILDVLGVGHDLYTRWDGRLGG